MPPSEDTDDHSDDSDEEYAHHPPSDPRVAPPHAGNAAYLRAFTEIFRFNFLVVAAALYLLRFLLGALINRW